MIDKLLLYKALKNKSGAEVSASGNPAIMTNALKNNPMNEMKVYGWSKQERTTGAQLFPTITPSIEEKNGITVEYMEHGKIHISGTSEKTVDFTTPTFELLAGTYTLSMGVNIDNTLMRCTLSTAEGLPYFDILNNEASKVETTEDNMILYLLLRVYGGKTIDITIQPMLNTGTSTLPWEPYTGGQPSPSPYYPQEIVSAGMKWSAGKNLLNYERLAETSPLIYKVENSMLTVLNSDGRSWDSIPGTFVLKAGTYCTSGDTVEIFKASDNSAISFNHTPFTLAEDTEVKIKVGADGTVFPYISKAMIEAGTETTNYEPYDGGVPKLYGDKIGIEVRGKNLVNIPDSEFTGIKLIPITLKKGTYWFVADIKPNESDKSSIMFQKNEEEKAFYYLEQKNGSLKQITLTEDVDEIILYSGDGYVDSIDKVGVYKNIMISVDKPTAYEPYHEPQSISISTPTGLPAIPVDSDGNYTDANGQQWISDYVDLKRGKYVQNICDLPLKDISLEWDTWGVNVNASNGTGFFAYVKKYAHVGNTKALATICRHHTDAWGGRKVGCSANVNNSYITISLYTSDLDDASDNTKAIASFKKIVEQTDAHVLYVRAEPIERDLTSEEIEAYKNLVTYAGTTIVENDAECYMEVSAGGGDALRAKKLALILGD